MALSVRTAKTMAARTRPLQESETFSSSTLLREDMETEPEDRDGKTIIRVQISTRSPSCKWHVTTFPPRSSRWSIKDNAQVSHPFRRLRTAASILSLGSLRAIIRPLVLLQKKRTRHCHLPQSPRTEALYPGRTSPARLRYFRHTRKPAEFSMWRHRWRRDRTQRHSSTHRARAPREARTRWVKRCQRPSSSPPFPVGSVSNGDTNRRKEARKSARATSLPTPLGPRPNL